MSAKKFEYERSDLESPRITAPGEAQVNKVS